MQKYWWYQTQWHSKMDKSMQVNGMGERTREAYLRSMRQLVEHYDKMPDLITCGPEYLDRYPDMPLQHKKTIEAIINCRSGHYGAAVYQCGSCGMKHLIDRSCGNRHCPQCQYHKSSQWRDVHIIGRGHIDRPRKVALIPQQLLLARQSPFPNL